MTNVTPTEMIETRLSDVQGEQGQLFILGQPLQILVSTYSYTELAAQLWQTADPSLDLGTDLAQQLGQARQRAYQGLSSQAQVLQQIGGIAALRLGLDLLAGKLDPENAIDQLAALGISLVLSLNPAASPPDPAAEHLSDLMQMLRQTPASTAEMEALSCYLLTVSEHGMNASTYTARVIASTRSDLLSCLAGALGALKGPLHGGAPGPVLDMLDAIGSPEQAPDWIARHLQSGERLMGFGHRIYQTRDPRADVLKQVLKNLQTQHGSPRLALAEAVEQAALVALSKSKPHLRLQTNVEFYTALLLEALGFPREAFTSVFALGRILGWTAHVLEQRSTGRLIRPPSRYIGEARITTAV